MNTPMVKIKIEYPMDFSEYLEGVEVIDTYKIDSMDYDFSMDVELLISTINIIAAAITISEFIYRIKKYLCENNKEITIKTPDNIISFNEKTTSEEFEESIKKIKDDLGIN